MADELLRVFKFEDAQDSANALKTLAIKDMLVAMDAIETRLSEMQKLTIDDDKKRLLFAVESWESLRQILEQKEKEG